MEFPEEEYPLANTKSALKALRQSEKRHQRNKAVRSATRTHIKKARLAVENSPQEEAHEAVGHALRALDRATQKGIIHANNAARRKSRLMKLYNTKFPAAAAS